MTATNPLNCHPATFEDAIFFNSIITIMGTRRRESGIVGEFYPDLNNIPYVAVAWQLIEEFEDSWDRSQQVVP
jgi:hypothetical protein